MNYYICGMKRTILALAALLCCIICSAQRLTRAQYIEKYAPLAVEQMKRSGIPASITLAQACLESGDGNSRLATEANNHFGIKCHGWNGRTIRHDDDEKDECFRKYRKVEESFSDHSDFLRYNRRYASLFELESGDYKGWAYGLKAAGYATSPSYAVALIKIIEDYGLSRYDRSEGIVLPPTPAQVQTISRVHPTKGSPLYKISLYREIFSRNGTAYIIAGELDSYSSLAKEYNLFKKELLGFNDLKSDAPIAAGTIVYLERKHKQSPRYLDKHVVEEGETMYALSQRYAVRLKYLYKYNGMQPGEEPQAGSIINLRKRTR